MNPSRSKKAGFFPLLLPASGALVKQMPAVRGRHMLSERFFFQWR
jgi:hypothetical protein